MASLVPVGVTLVAAGVQAFTASLNTVQSQTTNMNSGFHQTVQVAQDVAGQFAKLTLVGGAIASVVALITTAVGGLVQALGGFALVKFAAEVERDFKFVQAVVQATGQDMQQLRTSAEGLATSLAIPFRDLISQIRELARAGISIDGITNSVGKLTASLSILARGEASPAKVAEAIASGVKAFNLGEEAADRVAKSILGVANATRLSIPEVINAFNKAAPVAGVFDVTTEQLGAFIALVGSVGIRGEEAGTGIRNFFLRLSNPSREAAEQLKRFNISLFDVQGNTRPVVDVLADLEEVYGNQAIALGKLTPAQRAYSLSQIFQTRTAAVAALAIIQGKDAYNEYLDVIAQTDPILQASVATDNLLDKLLLLKNRGQVLADTFGQGLLPGLRAFVDNINSVVGDVSQPGNRARQIVGALGQAAGGLFTGQGIGQAADALESQFGSTIGNVFEQVGIQAARVREVISGQLIPAVSDFFAKLGELAVETVFNPRSVVAFGDAIVAAIGFTVGLVRALAIVVEGIRLIGPTAQTVARQIAESFGAVASAIGTTFRAISSVIQQDGKNIRTFGEDIEEINAKIRANPIGRAIIGDTDETTQLITNLGKSLEGLGTTGLLISDAFDGAHTSLQNVGASIQALQAREAQIRQVAAATRDWEQELGRLQQMQLAPEGPDVSDQINNVQMTIAAHKEYLRVMAGTTDAEDAVAAARALVKAATDALAASNARTEGSFDDLAEAGRRAAEQEKLIAQNTRQLQEIFEDASRSVGRSTREMEDKIDDLVNKTNLQFRRMEREVSRRMGEIDERLQEAADDAKEAFDFETLIRGQRTVVQRRFEDIGTIVSRSFDRQTRAFNDSIQDRETGRQREVQLYQQSLNEQLEGTIRNNAEVNEEYARAASERFQDIQRAFSRSQAIETEALQETFEKQNAARSRSTDNNERQISLARELSRAKTAEERKAIQDRFAEATIDLSRRRGIEDRETTIKKQQQDALRDLRLKQENEQLSLSRSIARQELQIRKDLASQEREFRIQQEFILLSKRFALEDLFVQQTRGLRENVDVPGQQRLQDLLRDAQRIIQNDVTRVDDQFRGVGFDRDAELRNRAADRQRRDVLRDADRQVEQVFEQIGEQVAQLARDAQQRGNDQLAQLLNQAADIQRRVGVNFPQLDIFRGLVPGLVQGGINQQLGAIGGLQGRLVPPSFGSGQISSGGSVPPELLTLALLPATILTGGMQALGTQLVDLTNILREKVSLGGVNVEIDDIVNTGIIIGDFGGDRFANIMGSAVGALVKPRAGR